jgi:hypothetical protein
MSEAEGHLTVLLRVYIATATVACQGIWLGQLLGDFHGTDPLIDSLDNKSLIQLCKNPVFHDQSKHIKVQYNFIKGCIEDGKIAVNFIGTYDQLADIFTKALGRVRLELLREKISVMEVK